MDQYYGDFGFDISMDDVVGAVKTAGTAIGGVVLAPYFEEMVEVTNPELKGAKISKAFKVIKRGDDYFVEINVEFEGIPSQITALAGQFAAVKLDDPKKAQEIPFQGLGKIKYEPPPGGKMILLIALGVVALGAAAFFIFGKKKAAPAPRRRKRKRKAKRRARKR